MKRWNLHIGGREAEAPRYEPVVNPFDGKPFAEAGRGGDRDMEDAISSAEKAFHDTRAMPSYRRRDALAKIAQEIRGNREEFARTIAIEAGKPIAQARGEVERAAITFSLAAEEATRIGGELLPVDVSPASETFECLISRFPIGVIGAISPFNFPLNLVSHKVAPALAAGNSVVLKPASKTPISSLMLAGIAAESGFPPGALNVVNCPAAVAEKMAADPRVAMITFTGSSDVGWRLKQKAWRKKVSLELGGNAAAIVHSDADVAWAAKRCALGSMLYAGQICISLQRIYAAEPVYEELRGRLVAEISSLPCGNPLDEKTVVGPMIDAENAGRVMEWIEEAAGAAAAVLCGGTRDGSVVRPTAIEGAPDNCRVKSEEVFGPVVTIDSYKNFDGALEAANRTRFGLQAAVFTRDLRLARKAYREIEAGGIVLNDFPTMRMDNYPYGGVKDSGTGREGVRFAIGEMTEMKVLLANTAH